MADLDANTQAADLTRIIGADSNGLETFVVKSHNTGDLAASDMLYGTAGAQGALTLGTSVVEAKVGSSRLTPRKLLIIFNNSNKFIEWGVTNSLTYGSGIPIEPKGERVFSVNDSCPIYIIGSDTNLNLRIIEK
jgi:hypothetical protein